MIDEDSKKAKKPRVKWYAWLIFLLLPLAAYTPILGSSLQMEMVGSEHVCCMPDNLRELLEKAKVARSRRMGRIVSGIIVGTIVMVLLLWLSHLIEWYAANTEEYYYRGGQMVWPFV